MINGVREFAEVFFDDVVVPADRILGEVQRRLGRRDEHPPVRALVVLLAAHRVPVPPARSMLVEVVPDDDRSAEIVGNAFLQLHALRARSRVTQHRLADGATLGAETSIDKVLVATAEHATYDAVRRLLPGVVEIDDSAAAEMWRTEYLYSRAATIYGGTAEVQRNIIARRLLDLGGRRRA